MSQYYNPQRTRNLYEPNSKESFRISRSKIELFINCPRCFYLDRRLGVGQPPGYPFTLNSAVDTLLKKEFDKYRAEQKPHPLFEKFGINALPFKHEKMDAWRDALRGGVTYLHKSTNLFITGGVDDIWVNPEGELIVADYKATSKEEEINALDKEWQNGYKRQAEIYQWLLRQNGFKVNNMAYFVYANGDTSKDEFNNILEFDTRIIPYEGDDSWVEGTIKDLHVCLNGDKMPKTGDDCDFCAYRESVKNVTNS